MNQLINDVYNIYKAIYQTNAGQVWYLRFVNSVIETSKTCLSYYLVTNSTQVKIIEKNKTTFLCPVVIDNNNYTFVAVTDNNHQVKLIEAYGTSKDTESEVVIKDITSEVAKFAGPNEDFFNSTVTPKLLGYSEVKLTYFDQENVTKTTLVFGENEAIRY